MSQPKPETRKGHMCSTVEGDAETTVFGPERPLLRGIRIPGRSKRPPQALSLRGYWTTENKETRRHDLDGIIVLIQRLTLHEDHTTIGL